MQDIANQIEFCSEGTDLPFDDIQRYIEWLLKVAKNELKSVSRICYTFCDDSHLLEINKKYLQHDYFTDIITFPYTYDPIESDIFISLDRVMDNALENNVTKEEELQRVMVHGLLHMCGYKDATNGEKDMMRNKESFYIKILQGL